MVASRECHSPYRQQKRELEILGGCFGLVGIRRTHLAVVGAAGGNPASALASALATRALSTSLGYSVGVRGSNTYLYTYYPSSSSASLEQPKQDRICGPVSLLVVCPCLKSLDRRVQGMR